MFTSVSKYMNDTSASAASAEASFSCSAADKSIVLILGAICLASIIIARISLITLLGVSVLGGVLIAEQVHRGKRQQSA